MTFFSSVPQLIGCILLFSRHCVAADSATSSSLSQKHLAAFAFTRHPLKSRSYSNTGHAIFQLQAQATKQNNPLFELMKDVVRERGENNNSGDIESVQDFDADLANEIQDALMSVSAGGNDENDKVVANAGGNNDNDKDTTRKSVNEPTKIINKQIVSPPIQNKAPQYVQKPKHTALAQVVANQYGFELTDISPLKGPGSRITAEDVEYHAWKVQQPPCTLEALELAHSLDLDLNFLYDDEDREYVMELSDIQLYQENLGSLNMASQTKKGLQDDEDTESTRKRMKKMSELDKRVEQNTGKLLQNMMKFAGTVTDGIVQQVQQVQQAAGNEVLREVGIFDDTPGKSAEDIKTVQDFDADLASEIEAALAGIDFGDENGDDIAVEPSPVGFTKEELPIETIEDIVADLASEINGDDIAVEPSPAGFTKEELPSLTCVQLKVLLRQRGMKVSGRKAELVERLLVPHTRIAYTAQNENSDDDKSVSSLFFAKMQ